MLTPIEVVLHSFVIFLLPLAVHSLATRRLPPEATWLGRLYRAEPSLLLASNLFLLALCASSIVRLGLHFGLIDRSLQESAEMLVGMPFLVLLVVYLGLLIRAALKLRRAAGNGA